MEAIAVNWFAVIVAAIIKFAIGAAWYAPPVFGKRWQALTGARMDGNVAPAFIVGFIGDVVMAYVLARFVIHYGAATFVDGAVVGFKARLGFVLTVMVGAMFYEKKPGELVAMNAGYQLVGIVVMGIILALWR